MEKQNIIMWLLVTVQQIQNPLATVVHGVDIIDKNFENSYYKLCIEDDTELIFVSFAVSFLFVS